MQVRIEHGVDGAKNAVSRGDAVIIVDTIRASTTYVNAFASGAKRIVPCSSREHLSEKFNQYPDSPAFRFWYLVNLGSWAEEYGVISAAREGVADLMRKHSKKIISLDPEFENGGGYFMLGAVHYKSPYIPFILSWPDNDKAISYLSKSINIGEAIPNQKVYFAQALYKDGKKNEAIKLLEEVANMQPSTDERVRDWDQIDTAKQLLKDYK